MDQVYDNILLKITKIKNNIEKIKEYNLNNNNNNNNIEYIEKLNNISSDINTLYANSEDLIDLYLNNLPIDELSKEDQNRVNENKIIKKVYDTFAPYMLYMQILLKNR